MKRFLISTLLCFLFSILFSQTKIDETKLDDVLEKIRQTYNTPGMAIAIVDNQKILYAKGFGYLEEGKRRKVNENTNFAIASNTKAFTATALAILVDENRISLDDKVTKYIPWFKLYNPFVTEQMTVRDLLCHRTGLKTFSGDLIWYASDHSREEVVRRAAYLKPEYGFREKFGYSNIMYIAAGLIVEYVTDTTWDDFIKHRIFEPLEMNRTNTSITVNNQLDNVASCHTFVDDKNIVIPYVNWDNIGPAGSINSNVNDVAKWLILNINKGKFKGKQIFSEKQYNELTKPHTIIDISPFSKSINPSTHFKAYGLGWTLYDYKSFLIVTHNGGYDGMISQTVFIPEKNLGFVILTNNMAYTYNVIMLTLLDYLIDNRLDLFWSDYFLKVKQWVDNNDKEEKEKWEAARVKNTQPSFKPEAYCGVYKSDVYGDVKVSLKDKKLYLEMTHTPIYQGYLKHWHYDVFSVKFDQAPSLPAGSVQFLFDKYGNVTEMRIDIPNPDFDFTELKLYKHN